MKIPLDLKVPCKMYLFFVLGEHIFKRNDKMILVEPLNMKILFNEHDFQQCKDKFIIQKFIEDQYEFSAFMMCIKGKIINWKIIKFKYEKFTIKLDLIGKILFKLMSFDCIRYIEEILEVFFF